MSELKQISANQCWGGTQYTYSHDATETACNMRFSVFVPPQANEGKVPVLLGAVIGASLALLTAPQSGKRTRKRLIRAVSSAGSVAGDRWGDLSEDVRGAVSRGRRRVRL